MNKSHVYNWQSAKNKKMTTNLCTLLSCLCGFIHLMGIGQRVWTQWTPWTQICINPSKLASLRDVLRGKQSCFIVEKPCSTLTVDGGFHLQGFFNKQCYSFENNTLLYSQKLGDNMEH